MDPYDSPLRSLIVPFPAKSPEVRRRLLSDQGEKSINFDFIMVPVKKKVLKYGTPKPKKSSSNKETPLVKPWCPPAQGSESEEGPRRALF